MEMDDELKEEKLNLGAEITRLVCEFRRRNNVEVTNIKLCDQGLLGGTFTIIEIEKRPEFDCQPRFKIGEEKR
jgi:hypothetical protein